MHVSGRRQFKRGMCREPLFSCFLWHVWTKDVFACLISNTLETKRQWCEAPQSCEAQFLFLFAKHWRTRNTVVMWETVVVKELHWCRNTVILHVQSCLHVQLILHWTDVDRVGQIFCWRLQRFGYRVQVRTMPAELRMSGIRIHSHAQLSSCGYLGTPETAKLLHSTPACVWGLKQFTIRN